jgi:Mg-chelatase subunit ChlD
MDMEATRHADQPQSMVDKGGMDDRVGGGEAKPADPRAGASMGMGSSSAPMPEPDMARPPTTVTPGKAMPQQAVADVRAGEWDDNANYRDYVKWLKETPRGIARLDISDRQFLVVKDKDGKPVPNCKLTVTGGQGSTTLITMASGRALLFPHDSGLDGQKLTATAACTQAKVTAEIERKLDGVSELVLASARALPARRTIDLAFVLDTTGSMSEEIGAVKATIRAVATKLSNDQTDVRIGLVEYKDHGDENVTRTFPFSSDLAAFGKSVDGLSANGGGDYPEDMQAGLGAALDKLQWRDNAVARLVVVIADAPPHLDYQNEKDYADAARRASSRGIKLYTVSASGMDATGQIVMRQMAQYTGASNLFVLRGGAGPQSVGGGDPKSSCGGTQEQYTSGKLDQLIINKVRQELASIDADPMRIAGIGKDESSKPCNQRIVMAY